ncbi:DJ-1/PfpI family protein [Poriferisphaera sp. WC338]|uniref:DJ-1/PfpI family protein n=1 Tax=Poriferisphaera sp. WC338 TaxID=3425129 RepID=UPI003D815DFA
MVEKLLMITGDFGEDYEIMAPLTVLKTVGFEVHVGCPEKKKGDTVASCVHDINDKYQTVTEWEGHRINLNVTLDKIKPEDYVGLILPGGRSCEYLRTYPVVRQLTSHFVTQNKPIASICRGVQILIATGLMRDRHLTGNFVCETEVEIAGGHFEKLDHQGVVVDNNIVSAVEWHGMWAWMRAFLKALDVEIIIKDRSAEHVM